MALVNPLWAQESNTDSVQKLDEVVVTGSRLLSAEDSVSPIQQFGADALNMAPTTSLTEFLFEQLPSNYSGSTLAQTADQGSGEFGGNRNASIDLRGLGPENTLVLINGERTVEWAAPNRLTGWRAVDLNQTIPNIAIGSVEVLLDGGSALYGSDAVGGVINVLPDYGFRGFKTQFRSLHHGEELGTPDMTFSAMAGAEVGDSTSIIFAAEYRYANGLTPSQIGLIDINSDPQPGDVEFDARNPNGFHTFVPLTDTGALQAADTQADPFCANGSQLGLDPLNVGNLVVNPPTMSMGMTVPGGELCEPFAGAGPELNRQIQRRNFTAFTAFEHTFDSPLTIRGDVTVSRNEMTDRDVYGGTVSSFNTGQPFTDGLLIPANNPGVLYAETLEPGQWSDPDGYVALAQSDFGFQESLRSQNISALYRTSFAASYDFNDDWSLDFGVSYARNEVTNEVRQAVPARFADALAGVGGPACAAGSAPGDPNCFYFNPFMSSALPNAGALGLANDPSLLSFITPRQTNDFTADFSSWSLLLSGSFSDIELGGGPLGLAVGLNHRTDELSIVRDGLTQSAAYRGQTIGATNIAGEVDVMAAFFEVALPLTEEFTVQLAGRFEDYDVGFDSFDPKIGFNWAPADYVTVRASYGESFRAPSIIHSQGNAIERRLLFTVDNASPQPNAPVGPGTMVANFPVAQQQVPNFDIKPQEATNFTAGFDFHVHDALDSSTDIGELDISFDYVSIEFENLIDLQGGADVLQLAECNIGSEPAPNDPRGEDVRVTELIPANNPDCFSFAGPYVDGQQNIVSQVFTRAVNLAKVEMDAIDLGVSWRKDVGIGELSINPRLTYLLKYDEQATPGAPVLERAGTSDDTDTDYPEWRVVMPIGLRRDDHNFVLTTRYISAGDPIEVADQPVDSSLYFDFTWSWDASDNLRVIGAVNNLTAERNDNLFVQSNLPPYLRRYSLQLSYEF